MADDAIELSGSDLREVTGFAVACARRVLALYADGVPGDSRPHAAVDVAAAFVAGAERSKRLRDDAWAAHRAAQEARDAGHLAASDAARAAGHAAGAAFLHPLAKATQVKHILGSAAHAARAVELAGGGDGADHVAEMVPLAGQAVREVLRRYPAAPPGGGRVGELMRLADAALR